VGVEGVFVLVYPGGVHWGPFPLGRAPGCFRTAGAIAFINIYSVP